MHDNDSGVMWVYSYSWFHAVCTSPSSHLWGGKYWCNNFV